MNTSNNKRIAKNTLFLYIRMLFVMLTSIYTSRVILATLGVSDFGIYNVVGGVVAFLGFLNGSMSNAVQRFLSFELGRGDLVKTNHVFCTALFAHFLIALFVIVVLESVGPWFISTQMTLPSNRLYAAHWVFHCSVITTFFTILQVPYNAIIIAKEQMGFYAYISILEVLLKLGIVYFLLIISYDSLIVYAILQTLVTISILQLNRMYCMRKFREAKFHIVKEFATLKEIGGFAVWNMFGEFTWSLTNQGTSVLVNIFAGPIANAAQGLSVQVNAAVMNFVGNFQTALNPQIIKSYSSANFDEMVNLVSRGSRISFYLLLLLSLPLIFEMDYVLHLWLKEVPKDAKEFCQLALICSLVMTITNLLVQVIRATGNIRKYQFVSAILLLVNFPMAWITLNIGYPPYIVLVTLTIVHAANNLVRLYFAKKQVNYPIGSFIKRDASKMLLVLIVSCFLPILILNNFAQSNGRFITIIIVTFGAVVITSFSLGLNSKEKRMIISEVKKQLSYKVKNVKLL